VAGAEVAFPHARQIARLDRRREDLRTGAVSTETVYLITSLEPTQADAARLGALVRAHWSIENQLHWRRDWSFDEDRSRIRHPTGAQVMTSLRNLAIAWAATASPLRHRPRQRCLPQQQRQLAAQPQIAIAAITKPWPA
jgi:hypothetical protein